jgi:hypothetical protein
MRLECGLMEGRIDEADTIYRRADYRGFAGGGGWFEDRRSCAQAGVSEATLYNWKAK